MRNIPRLLRSVLAVIALATSSTPSVAQITPLAANDVSWLFPAPKDLADMISMDDLKSHGDPIWSDDAFHQFLAIATGPAGRVRGTDEGISLPDPVQSKRAWYIAAVRFDPSAPGFSKDIHEQLGQELQIRLVVQPVTRNADGTLKVHDIAAHLIFEFNTGNDGPKEPGCFPRPRPDLGLSKQIAQELVKVRATVREAVTSGNLGVHPGLANPADASNLRRAMKELLERHLSSERLGLITITAIKKDVPDTWFFLAMINQSLHPHIYSQSPGLGFIPMPAPALDGYQFAQMLKPNNQLQNLIVPIPYANNNFRVDGHSAMTCRNGANQKPGPPLDQRIGYATADILDKRPLTDSNPGKQDYPPEPVMRAVLDTIVDPDRSHVFNTDCVSCHTETPLFQQRFRDKKIQGIDPLALPGDNRYNMRAFGWAPEHNIDHPNVDTVRPTVSRRTACETAKVVDYINHQLLGASAIAPIPGPRNDAECPNKQNSGN
jgi:hypothetical protein